MSSAITKMSLASVVSRAATVSRGLCSSSAAAAGTGETRTQKLERIADELLSLTKLERYDYSVLFRHKIGLNKFGPAVSVGGAPGSAADDSKGAAPAAEKTAFDIKLEKFDAAAKLKVVKEVKAFADLGLKEAKDLVDKAPIVVKKAVTKDAAEAFVAKLKELGATAVLE